MKASFTVTDLDAMVWFRRMEDMETEELVARLRRQSVPNAKMLMGTAFHAVLENPPDVIDTVEMNGFRFRIDCDAEIILPQIREIRASKEYFVNGVTVTLSGGCDGITGNEVTDHKLTFRPEPENYLDSFQWKAYLDIYHADIFTYYLYHAKEDREVISICDISALKLYRYPGMEDDVRDGISDLVSFAKEHLPEKFSA